MTKEEWSKWYRERKEYRIQHKRCTSCGKQDSRTLGGYHRCNVCYGKAKVRYRTVTRENRKALTDKGLCNLCGVEIEDKRFIRCEKCRLKERGKMKKYQERWGIAGNRKDENNA